MELQHKLKITKLIDQILLYEHLDVEYNIMLSKYMKGDYENNNYGKNNLILVDQSSSKIKNKILFILEKMISSNIKSCISQRNQIKNLIDVGNFADAVSLMEIVLFEWINDKDDLIQLNNIIQQVKSHE